MLQIYLDTYPKVIVTIIIENWMIKMSDYMKLFNNIPA